MSELPPDVVDAILARLGFAARPDAGADGLAAVYLSWCRTVPFDNLVKRIHLASGARTPFPNAQPSAFFDSFLRHGTGGTCWPSSLALHALLRALGFEARLGSCAMRDDLSGPVHTHATVLVEIDGRDHWVDSSMLSERALPLTRGAETRLDEPLHELRAEPVGDLWRVWWENRSRAEQMGCLMLADDVSAQHCQTRYEASRDMSPFNTMLYTTVNRSGRVVTVAMGKRRDKDSLGVRSTDVPDGWAATLIEEFGYSEEIVSRLPADEPPAVTSS